MAAGHSPGFGFSCLCCLLLQLGVMDPPAQLHTTSCLSHFLVCLDVFLSAKLYPNFTPFSLSIFWWAKARIMKRNIYLHFVHIDFNKQEKAKWPLTPTHQCNHNICGLPTFWHFAVIWCFHSWFWYLISWKAFLKMTYTWKSKLLDPGTHCTQTRKVSFLCSNIGFCVQIHLKACLSE